MESPPLARRPPVVRSSPRVMSSRATWGNTPLKFAEHLSQFAQPPFSERTAASSAIERLNAHVQAVEGDWKSRPMPLPCPVLQTRESKGRAAGPAFSTQQPRRLRSPHAAATALGATAGAQRPRPISRVCGSEVESSTSPSCLRHSLSANNVSNVTGLGFHTAEPLPQGRLSPCNGSIVTGSTSQPPRQRLSLSPEGIKKLVSTEYVLPQSPRCHAHEADLDPGSKSHTSNPNLTTPCWASSEAFAERLSEKLVPVWAGEAQDRELRDEQAWQAHMPGAVESRLREEIGTLKEVMAVSWEQMEARLNTRCTGLVEEEAAVRRAVESHLEARLVTLQSEVLLTVRTEMEAQTKDFAAKLRRTVESHLEARLATVQSEVLSTVRTEMEAYAEDFALIRAAMKKRAERAAAAAVAVEAARPAAAGEPDEEAGEEGPKEVPEKPEHRGKRSRSPKKQLVAMQPLQEQPDKEHLARLDEAVEREMRSRAELEQRLESQLQAVSAQVQAARAVMQRVCNTLSVEKGELKLVEVPAKDFQPSPFHETMAEDTLKTSIPGLDSSSMIIPGDRQPQIESLLEAAALQSQPKQTGEKILEVLSGSSSEQTRIPKKSMTGNSTHSLTSVF